MGTNFVHVQENTICKIFLPTDFVFLNFTLVTV